MASEKHQPIIVPMPFITDVDISKRLLRIRNKNNIPDGMFCYLCNFYPPNSIEEWPKTIGDIGDLKLKSALEWADSGAAGSNP